MEKSFLGRLTPCLQEYERPGVRIQALAELAPGIIAVFLMRWSYSFVIFFDRSLHRPSLTMLALWGESVLHPPPWENRGIGFLPTNHEYPWANFNYLIPFAKQFFPKTTNWHKEPIKIAPPPGIGTVPGPEWRRLYPQKRDADGRFCH
jgi:hypothetical protein